MLEIAYQTVLRDVLRYRYLSTEGFQEWEDEPDLPPAAAEALRFLADRVASELRIPDWMARRGLFYAAGRHTLAPRLFFITLSTRLQTAEASPA